MFTPHHILRRALQAVMPALAALTLMTAGARGQIATGAIDTSTVVVDSSDVFSVARAAQARFERRRIRYLPLSIESFGGSCDEVVGRLCTTFGEGEWYPTPEDERIVDLRKELVAQLDSLQGFAPGNGWIFGQRVWYRIEGGQPAAALRTARSCGAVESWWCLALQGFALHELERYEDSEEVFRRALTDMEPEQSTRWRRPRWPVDSDLRDLIEDVEDDAAAAQALIALMWRLADPLYLAEGNDRLTAHYARWTSAELRARARNPFRLSWSEDLDQLTVRHGWEMGWERSVSPGFGSVDQVVGHKHPEGRDYMPPGDVLEDLAGAEERDLRADRRRPRSLYAPTYAPVLLPMEGQVALFPRGERTAIVATHFLPDDTTYHADHAHPLPWMEYGAHEEESDRIGVFALFPDRDDVVGVEAVGTTDGALLLEVPSGDVVVSAESWSPSRRRAGRVRVGRAARRAPEDIATLSDVLFLEPASDEPETLEQAVGSALPRASLQAGQAFAIGWEVAGLGFRPETLRFEVSVERTDRSVFSRIGGFLRITGRPSPLTLSWEEPGPAEPGHEFHYLALDLPPLDPGRYEIRLVLRTRDRSDAQTAGVFEIAEPR